MHLQPPRIRAQHGFTLTELMIAITLGLIILTGMSTLFVNNSKAQAEIEKANRQIENGRYGIQMLSGDLRHAGFYAEFDPVVLPTPGLMPDPCALALADLKLALPLHVQGIDNAPASALDCLSDLRPGTDVLVLRHTRTCVADAADCEPFSAGGPYFQASLCNNPSELDSGVATNFFALDVTAAGLTRRQRNCTQVAGSGSLALVRRYQTHIYFIANNDKPNDRIPTLKRAELGSTGSVLSLTIVPLVEGIENLQFEYGLDNNTDGVPDLFSANPLIANGCALDACQAPNWRQVVAVKLNLLARNIEPSPGYTDTKSYVLGRRADGSANIVAAANDQYKRHVFQAVVNLPNPAGRRLP